MKTVFDNDMVAHVWAQDRTDGRQPHGRSSNGNFYFDGGALYSYGSHFMVAKAIKLPDGTRIALFNERSYSISTSRHQRLARQAWSGPSLTVANPNARTEVEHIENVVKLVKQADECDGKAARARSDSMRNAHGREAARLRATAERYSELFLQGKSVEALTKRADKLSREAEHRNTLSRYTTAEHTARHGSYYDKSAATRRRGAAEAVAIFEKLAQLEKAMRIPVAKRTPAPAFARKLLAYRQPIAGAGPNFSTFVYREANLDAWAAVRDVVATYVSKWRNGDRASVYDLAPDTFSRWQFSEARSAIENLPIMLRIKADGETVETSRGAEFPVDHARRAWPIMVRIKARGTAWARNGETVRLGPFQIDSIAVDGTITAGCHVLPWNEAERMAALLGVA